MGKAKREIRVRMKINKVCSFGIKKRAGVRPRLSVFVSGKHIYAQIIDDNQRKTLVAASDMDTKKGGKSLEKAVEVGNLIAKKAKLKGIKSVVFDRGERKYHGRIKALAQAVREGGIKF